MKRMVSIITLVLVMLSFGLVSTEVSAERVRKQPPKRGVKKAEKKAPKTAVKKAAKKVEDTTVSGMLQPSVNKKGKVTALMLKDDEGNEYNVMMNPAGKKMVKEFADKRVEVTGQIVKMKGKTWIKVKEFKAAEEKAEKTPPAEEEAKPSEEGTQPSEEEAPTE